MGLSWLRWRPARLPFRAKFVARALAEGDRALRLHDWAAAAARYAEALRQCGGAFGPADGSRLARRRGAILAHLGYCLFQQGDAAGGESALRRALELGEMTPRQTAETYLQLAECQKKRGDIAGGEASLRRAIAIDDRFDLAHHQLGMLLRQSWRQREAPAIFLSGLRSTGSALLRRDLEDMDYLPSEIDDAVACGALPEVRVVPDDPDFPPHPIDSLRERVNSHAWFHSINLGGGIVTPGIKSRAAIAREASAIFAPLSVGDRSVADIGAWNGCFTVEAKRRGAGRILALDEYTWSHPGFRGKDSFDLVMARLGIEAETRLADIQTAEIDAIGRWQIVLCLGVFYHLLDPIAALRSLAEITQEVLVLETHLDLRDHPAPAMAFYPGSELDGDHTNWWGPNRAAVEALLTTFGFPKVLFTPNPSAPETRGFFHAFKSQALFYEHTGAGSVRASQPADERCERRSAEVRPP